MKISSLLCLPAVLLLLACGNEAPVFSLEENFQRINQEVLANSEAYERLEEITSTIGHRLAGSENGRKAEEYTANLFRSYGIEDVSFQEFELEGWSRVSLETYFSPLNAGNWKMYPSVALAHTPVEADVEGEIIHLGNGLPEDYEQKGSAVAGKIVLVYLGILPGSEGAKNLHRSEKTALASQNGAKGIIFYNAVPGGILLTGTASVTGRLIDIPAVCITHEDGMALAEQLKKEKLKTKISMRNQSGMTTARNVIATIKGSELPDEVIIVGGHLDSWDLATGATDNGIGTFAIIDMARTFKALDLKPKRTIQFIMFMGEELGLLGSKAYVAKAKQEGRLENIRYMMNIDMGGNPSAFSGGGRDEAEDFFVGIGEKIKAVDSIFINNYMSYAGLHSDHQPFMLEGIPYTSQVSNLDRSIFRCYHADCDNFDLINREHMVNSVRFSVMQLFAMADADEIPVRKLNDEETKQFLIDQNLKLKLQLGGDWRWED